MYRTNDRIQNDHYLVYSYNYYKLTTNYNVLTIQDLVFSLVVCPDQFFHQQPKLTNNLEHGQMY